MWDLHEPKPVKLIFGILAADKRCMDAAVETVRREFGEPDLSSDVWPFTQTDYYFSQTGGNILRRFLSIETLVDPGELAAVKHRTNEVERRLAKTLGTGLPRPVNLDPGIVEPSKLVLATTKNYSHRIYIGDKIYAEVTLMYGRGGWQAMPYTYSDYRQRRYIGFFERVRRRLLEQLKSRQTEH